MNSIKISISELAKLNEAVQNMHINDNHDLIQIDQFNSSGIGVSTTVSKIEFDKQFNEYIIETKDITDVELW